MCSEGPESARTVVPTSTPIGSTSRRRHKPTVIVPNRSKKAPIGVLRRAYSLLLLGKGGQQPMPVVVASPRKSFRQPTPNQVCVRAIAKTAIPHRFRTELESPRRNPCPASAPNHSNRIPASLVKSKTTFREERTIPGAVCESPGIEQIIVYSRHKFRSPEKR